MRSFLPLGILFFTRPTNCLGQVSRTCIVAKPNLRAHARQAPFEKQSPFQGSPKRMPGGNASGLVRRGPPVTPKSGTACKQPLSRPKLREPERYKVGALPATRVGQPDDRRNLSKCSSRERLRRPIPERVEGRTLCWHGIGYEPSIVASRPRFRALRLFWRP